MKPLVVMKKRSHRVFVLSMAIAATLLPVLITVVAEISMGMVFLGFAPALLIVYSLAWYTLSWKLTFASKGITKSVFGVKSKSYRYQDIQDAVSGYFSADSAIVVRIVFVDGKAVKFRMNDENAGKAKKFLLSRHSIRYI